MSLLPVKKREPVDNNKEGKFENFVCDLCDKVFDKKSHMSNHRILVHTVKVKEMYCDFCEELFNTKEELISHISSKHAEQFKKQEPVALLQVKGEPEGEKEEKRELNYILNELKKLEGSQVQRKKAIEPKKK